MAGIKNKPVYLYGKKGNFIREFKNSVEFCKIFGFNKNFFAVKNSRK